MKRTLIVAAIAALFSAAALAQMGPGMMWGQGPGAGQQGEQCGPGGMMGGGYGPGAGRMGRGMMAGHGHLDYQALNLTDAQREKIATIEKDASDKRFNAMKAMHDLRWSTSGPGASKEADPRQTYDAMAAIRKQMFEANLDAQKRIEEILTPEQKEQWRKSLRSRG